MSNKVVSIEYTLTDADTKEQLDSNVGGAPLSYISGMQQIIPGLESELEKLNAGDNTDVLVKPADGYGEYNEEAVQTLPKEQFAGIELAVGMSLYGTGENGETVQVIVKDLKEDEVVIDYNHPMAGKTLMFTVLVTEVRDATAEEIQSGMVGGMQDSCCSDDGHGHDHAESGSGCCGGGSCS